MRLRIHSRLQCAGKQPVLSSETVFDPKSRNGSALAFLRVCVGVFFLVFGQYKVFGREFTRGGGVQFWIKRFIQDGAYPFMLPILKGFVLRPATGISYLVAYGELAIGISLLIGWGSKAASAFGFIYILGLLFSSDYPGRGVPLWRYFGASLDHSILALCFLAFLLGEPEQQLSMKHFRYSPP